MSVRCTAVKVVVASILLSAFSVQADLKTATTAFSSGNWKVLRDKDAMTDKTDCTGIYKNDFGIQLTQDTLFIRVSGGIESVTLRFGEDQPKPFRLSTKMEKDIRSAILTGTEFDELQNASRLRYQFSTLVSGIKSGEIDLTGFTPALENIKEGCPVQQPASSPESASQDPNSQTGTLCNATLVARMRQQGLRSTQIHAICK